MPACPHPYRVAATRTTDGYLSPDMFNPTPRAARMQAAARGNNMAQQQAVHALRGAWQGMPGTSQHSHAAYPASISGAATAAAAAAAFSFGHPAASAGPSAMHHAPASHLQQPRVQVHRAPHLYQQQQQQLPAGLAPGSSPSCPDGVGAAASHVYTRSQLAHVLTTPGGALRPIMRLIKEERWEVTPLQGGISVISVC